MGTAITDQRHAALRKANEVRVAQAHIKRQLGRCSSRQAALQVAELIEDGNGPAGGIPIWDLLLAVRGLSDARISRLLARMTRDIPPLAPRCRVQDAPWLYRRRLVGELRRLASRDWGYGARTKAR